MKKIKGFTLVELVITIAIVIILSVISVPIYRGYVDKAKWSEGYALMGTILSAQKTYYSEYGNFLNDGRSSAGNAAFSNKEDVLGIDARGNKYFTAFNIGYSADGLETRRFSSRIKLPTELITDTNKTCLILYYDVTSGATYEVNAANVGYYD